MMLKGVRKDIVATVCGKRRLGRAYGWQAYIPTSRPRPEIDRPRAEGSMLGELGVLFDHGFTAAMTCGTSAQDRSSPSLHVQWSRFEDLFTGEGVNASQDSGLRPVLGSGPSWSRAQYA